MQEVTLCKWLVNCKVFFSLFVSHAPPLLPSSMFIERTCLWIKISWVSRKFKKIMHVWHALCLAFFEKETICAAGMKNINIEMQIMFESCPQKVVPVTFHESDVSGFNCGDGAWSVQLRVEKLFCNFANVALQLVDLFGLRYCTTFDKVCFSRLN